MRTVIKILLSNIETNLNLSFALEVCLIFSTNRVFWLSNDNMRATFMQKVVFTTFVTIKKNAVRDVKIGE